MPKTTLGKAALILAAANIVVTAASLVLLARGDLGTSDKPTNTWIGAVSGLLAIAAMVTGAVAIVRSKERATALYVALGLIVLLFMLGELMFPH